MALDNMRKKAVWTRALTDNTVWTNTYEKSLQRKTSGFILHDLQLTSVISMSGEVR